MAARGRAAKRGTTRSSCSALVDEYLEALDFGVDRRAARLVEAMRYSLLAGGKRIRPVLTLATAASRGARPQDVLPTAAALELIHTYSLIHDDLPAIDDDTLRRGPADVPCGLRRGHRDPGRRRLVRRGVRPAARASSRRRPRRCWPPPPRWRAPPGVRGMVGGQYMDVVGDDRGDDDLRVLHALKTGRLIEAAVVCGALLTGAEGDAVTPYRAFAGELGLLFQIVDDILDEVGRFGRARQERRQGSRPAQDDLRLALRARGRTAARRREPAPAPAGVSARCRATPPRSPSSPRTSSAAATERRRDLRPRGAYPVRECGRRDRARRERAPRWSLGAFGVHSDERSGDEKGTAMKVFVAGATGTIGRRLVSLLAGAGHEVVGMSRDEGRAAALSELGARGVSGDVYDPDASLGCSPTRRPTRSSTSSAICRAGSISGRDKDAFAANAPHPDRGRAEPRRGRRRGRRAPGRRAELRPHLRAGGRLGEERGRAAQPRPSSAGACGAQRRGDRGAREDGAGDAGHRGGGVALRFVLRTRDALRMGRLDRGRGPARALLDRRGRARRTSFIHVDDAAAATVLALAGRPASTTSATTVRPWRSSGCRSMPICLARSRRATCSASSWKGSAASTSSTGRCEQRGASNRKARERSVCSCASRAGGRDSSARRRAERAATVREASAHRPRRDGGARPVGPPRARCYTPLTMAADLLSRVSGPSDLQDLSEPELTLLADEVRDLILDCVSEVGGHLAASLGTVELTVALHSILASPQDRIVWDVGHQCYAHKILTGRRDCFASIRQYGGLSGFPNRSESEHDVIGTGHASTSIGYGLGLVEAARLAGSSEGTVVCVVGDGALTGGVAFEALNQVGQLAHAAGRRPQRQPDVDQAQRGRPAALPQPHPSRPRPHPPARGLRAQRPADPGHRRPRVRAGQGRQGVDEGPARARHALRGAGLRLHRRRRRPRHARPAGEHPSGDRHEAPGAGARAHASRARATSRPRSTRSSSTAPGRSTWATATAKAKKEGTTYTEAFGEALVELAERDERICAITAAMTQGTGLEAFEKRFPERFYDVGIAEEHAVVFAAGLAIGGRRPGRRRVLDLPAARLRHARAGREPAAVCPWCSPSTAPASSATTGRRITAPSTSRTCGSSPISS